MTDKTVDMWNARYSEQTYAYGKEPNLFFKEQLAKLPVGRLLMGAEGEGRNAVYAATQGWTVSAFDISEAGKAKALELANEKDVVIDYRVGNLPDLRFGEEQFDVLGLIYAHFPPTVRSEYHKYLHTLLRPGGLVILEGFGKNHLEYRKLNEKVGGPADLETLFSPEEVHADFKNYDVQVLEERVIELNEGRYHNGRGSVVRFVGAKSI
ncbi:MAG TPA: class I SAM-dependent methyltransferase [Lunatimonas sp.]|nr:class I SAM-dependent methyltransferase [Lunatimonas sp.]